MCDCKENVKSTIKYQLDKVRKDSDCDIVTDDHKVHYMAMENNRYAKSKKNKTI